MFVFVIKSDWKNGLAEGVTCDGCAVTNNAVTRTPVSGITLPARCMREHVLFGVTNVFILSGRLDGGYFNHLLAKLHVG